MSPELRPFAPADLDALVLPAAAAAHVRAHRAAYAASVVAHTAWLDGRAIAAGGVLEMGWTGYGRAWALVAEGAPRRAFPALARATRATVDDLLRRGWRRIEATVDGDFMGGLGFAEHAGFKLEGLMRRYTPQGRDHWLLARTT